MNAPRPHDLLWGMPTSALPADAPLWARVVLAGGQPVVVRRAVCDAGWVAVGVRGQGRAQRLAALMRVGDIQRQQAPEALQRPTQRAWPALQALAWVAPMLDACGLAWGPTGGVGYQIATGIDVLHADSDLDLLVRTPQPLARIQARTLLAMLAAAPCRIDAQLETPGGAVALREWAGFAQRVLLKSPVGPCLCEDPWAVRERAA